MPENRINTWLRWLRATATFVFVAALCLAVAALVIVFVPGSSLSQGLPADGLSGLDRVGGVGAGAAVDPSGWIAVRVQDPSVPQRMQYLLTVLPGLGLVAEIARRMAALLRQAQAHDPFSAGTARSLVVAGRLTVIAGLGTWLLSQAAQAALSGTILTSPVTFKPHQSPLGWLAVGLILVAIGRILERGVAMRTELDAVI